jgi:hypothetical protein
MLQAVLIGSSYVFLSLFLPLLLLSSILDKKPISVIYTILATVVEVIIFIVEKTIQLYTFLNGCIIGISRDKVVNDSSLSRSDSNRSDDHSEHEHMIGDIIMHYISRSFMYFQSYPYWDESMCFMHAYRE